MTEFRIQNYLERIGWTDSLKPDLQTLFELHFHHATTIPFENLDIQMGLPIRLDPESLQNKLVDRKRGGYCFEQNSLFQAVLSQLGYQVIACEARVRLGRAVLNPRTHMLLLVERNGKTLLCDVGFGAELLHPVPVDGREHHQFLWTYRVIDEAALKVLQIKQPSGWLDLYAFYPQASPSIDFELANWYTSTHPESRFVQTLTAQLPSPEARYILRNRNLIINRGETEESREIQSAEELLRILRDLFTLPFPADTRFRNPQFDSRTETTASSFQNNSIRKMLTLE